MASTEASRRASVASSSEMSFADPATATKLLPKKDKATGGVKLKKSIAKKTKPKDTESNGTKTAGTSRSPSPNSPIINGANSKSDERPGTIQCKHCKKPVEPPHIDSHSQICLENKKANAKKKKEQKEAKARAKEAEDKDRDGDSIAGDNVKIARPDDPADAPPSSTKKTTTKKSAPKTSTLPPPTKKSKKRKASPEPSTEPKKKKLKKDQAKDKDDAPKPKLPKQKGPVNVELQCGVALPNGAFCARSLTCKSHSMGAKRAVPGRTLPYDQLLQMYQKKNQAKQQKAMLQAAAGPAVEEEEGGAVDSDEEREAVLKGVARWRPKPLEQCVFVPTGSRYRYVRMKDMLAHALTGRDGVGLFASAREDAGGGGGGGTMLQSPNVGSAERGPPLAKGVANAATAGGAAAAKKASGATGGGGA